MAAPLPTPTQTQQIRTESRLWPNLAIALIGLVPAVYTLVAYLRTLAPTVMGDDPGELQVLSWALGIPHTTGYPLYIWLGKLFTLLPFGDIGYRVNLLSAVFGAASVFMVYLVVGIAWSDRGWTRWLAGAAAGWMLGYSHMFWYEALIAEMYTLHVFLTLLVIYLATRWSVAQRDGLIMAGAFVWGAMFGNHGSTVALAPGLGLFALVHNPRQWLDWRRVGKVLGALLLGVALGNLLLFWLLWQRHLPFDHWHGIMRTAWELYPVPQDKADSFWFSWWFTVSGGQFRATMFSAPEAWRSLQIDLIPYRVMGQFFPAGALVALAGWALLWKRWRLNLLLSLIFLTQCFLNVNYHVPWKVFVYYVTPYAMAAIWIGVALAAAGAALEAGAGWVIAAEGGWRNAARAALPVALMLPLLLGLHAWNQAERAGYAKWLAKQPKDFREAILPSVGKRPDFSKETKDRDRARALVDKLPPDAIVFTTWDIQYAIEYVARIERDIQTMSVYEAYPYAGARSGTFSKYRWDLIREQMGKRPIFFTYNPSRDVGRVYKVVQFTPGLWVLAP